MALSVDITKRLGKFFLNVSFETEGCIMGILGKSGCGKSMTLKCIAGIEKPDTGRIVLDGKVFFDSEKHINLTPQKRSVGYLFQNYALFPGMTVEENIAVTMKGSKAERAEQVRKELERFGLSGLEKQYPGELSGGQAQRVALARMLVTKPSIILLDEPFSALDASLKEKLQEDLFRMMSEYGGEVIMVTHDRNEVYKFCPSLMVINEGHTVITGNTRDIFKDPCYCDAAVITGCKNISAARRIDDHTVEAVDWHMKLHTAVKAEEDIRYVGIRAMNIEEVGDGSLENTIPVRLHDSMQTQFDIMVYCESRDDPGVILTRRTAKYTDEFIPVEEPKFWHMPPESLLLLK